MKGNGLDLKKVRVIALRLQGMTWAAIGRQLDVDTVTIWEWRTQDETFKRELARQEKEAKEDAIRLAKKAARKMVETSIDKMETVKPETPEDVRRWAETGVKLTRLNEGESTENIAATVEPVRPRTQEEIDAAQRRLNGD